MRRTFLLGILSGGRVAFGLSILASYFLFLHHMFIIGLSPGAYVLGALPAMLVFAGTVIAIRIITRQGATS